ncbi:MAG: hypothetical protein EOP51_06045, partial [Sphingobacteriales bacterium]
MNIKQHTFITYYLQSGDKVQAYKAAYQSKSNNENALESAANRLLRRTDVSEALRMTLQTVRGQAESELKDQLRVELLSVNEKRAMLASIARGEPVPQSIPVGNDVSRTGSLLPTINQRLKAIDIDNRISGLYHKAETNTEETEQEIGELYAEIYQQATENNKAEQDTTNGTILPSSQQNTT